ncbi:helix-turn-helix domain-containing protein [Nocardiopsis sp. NPDC101807]|uniref:helix-turn-helix domain-containing protein n=1 Tax=Nocardiopsis sp. NPDC101807 TaxID=3364339 RepID=UPI0038309242
MANRRTTAPTAPTVARWLLAKELRRLRGDRQFTAVVKAVKTQPSSLARWESGRADGQVPSANSLDRLLNHYDVSPDEATRLMELRTVAKTAGWWQSHEVEKHYGTLIGLEAAASEMSSYEVQLIPGLLQTEEYARSVITSGAASWRGTDEEIEDLVQVRMRRQADWTERGTPHLWAIVGEAAIRQAVGGPSVMHDQLARLLDLSRKHTRLTLQVLPYSAGSHTAMEMACFAVLDVEDAGLSTVYVEGPTANLFLDSPEDVTRYRRIFEHLRKSALGTSDTRALVAHVMEGFTHHES